MTEGYPLAARVERRIPKYVVPLLALRIQINQRLQDAKPEVGDRQMTFLIPFEQILQDLVWLNFRPP